MFWKNKKGQEVLGGSVLAIIVILIILALMFGYPQYKVWQQGLEGKAELSKADWNRQIAIEEAKANLEAQKLNKESEIVRAEGLAEANKIVAESLKGNDEYLRYLWINKLGENQQDVIYIPTETGLPIMEANRLNTN